MVELLGGLACRDAVRRAIKQGKLRAKRSPGGHYRVTRTDAEAYREKLCRHEDQ